METDRQALAERLDDFADRCLMPAKLKSDIRAAATALREEGEPVGWVMPKSLEFNRGRAGPPISLYMTQFSTAQIPLYRHPHTEEPTDG